MGSIRPLVTITILVVVGAYLYVKINEGPVPSHAGAASNWSQAPDGVPPLAGTKGASLATDSSAPAWPSAAAQMAPPANATAIPNSATGNAPSAAANAKDKFPTVPAIPELPPLPSTNDIGSSTAQPPAVPPKDLPTNIPQARYPDEPGQTSIAAPSRDTLGQPSPLALSATDPGKLSPPAAVTQAPLAPQIAAPPTNVAPLQSAPSGLGSTPAAPQSQTSAQNPLRATSPASDDRYGSAQPGTTPLYSAPAPTTPIVAPSAPSATTFAASWPTIQAALDRGDLKLAHQLLSKWHGNDLLTPSETDRVETLLGQLAGTVIYSTEHQLEPARVVKPGETLETISKEYNVPSQLLAKINGIQTPDQLRPGQELKVVRGPFSAIVDLRRNEMTLMVDDRYAGKFRVSVPPGTTLSDGQWLVDQKLAGPASTANPSAYATTPIAADRTIILRNAAAAAGSPTLIIGSGPAPTGLAASLPSLRISPQDAEELSDILSIGSRVVVRK